MHGRPMHETTEKQNIENIQVIIKGLEAQGPKVVQWNW